MVFNGEGCAIIVYYTLTQNQWRKKKYDEEGKELEKERKREKKSVAGWI